MEFISIIHVFSFMYRKPMHLKRLLYGFQRVYVYLCFYISICMYTGAHVYIVFDCALFAYTVRAINKYVVLPL